MFLLGYDIGSSSVKTSIVDVQSGKTVGSAFSPCHEAPIHSIKAGWAEQHPNDWWTYLKESTAIAIRQASEVGGCRENDLRQQIAAIGISYQMHGLVCVDKQLQVLRPAIIWCDSRAVPYGEKAQRQLGDGFCLQHLLNTPGNFTAAKLAWVKENEPDIYRKIHKVMLPGDYIAMRLTGELRTTVSGLSEGIFWDFNRHSLCHELMESFGFDEQLIPTLCPTFGEQGYVMDSVAQELGIRAGIPVTYRAGDQPNNALSLNVLHPGEVASTAGTSGVVYGVNDQKDYDPLSRVNTFAHVNHTAEQTRLGILLCINGTGILNSWIRRHIAPEGWSYDDLNRLAATAPIGSEGLSILPFGNGTERMLNNTETGCSFHGVQFNLHHREHLLRAAQEGIAFAFHYGMDIMRQMGMNLQTIHAGNANMFLSPIFRNTLAGISGATIELYDTDGSVGAAKGAGLGAGIYRNHNEAFASLQRLAVIEPDLQRKDEYATAYRRWEKALTSIKS